MVDEIDKGAPGDPAKGAATPADDMLVAEEPLKAAGDNADFGATTAEATATDDESAQADAEGDSRKSAAQTIRDEAGRLGAQAKERARSFAGEGKDRATGALEELSKMFEGAAGEVDSRLGEDYGKYARSAAEGIAGFADTLRNKDVDNLIDDAAAFVRKSPMIAIGTAAALGFVLARLIKAGVDAAADAAEGEDRSDARG